LGEKKNAPDELQSYQDQVPLMNSKPIEVLSWWKLNEKKFPRISVLARTYLAAQATAVPCERIFSDAGNLVTAKRSRLSPETIEKDLFIYENRDFFS